MSIIRYEGDHDVAGAESLVVMPVPTDAVEACLRGAVAAAVADRAAGRAADDAGSSAEGTGCEPEVDSLVASEVLATLGEQFGIDLPDDVAPAGECADAEECVEHLFRGMRAAWKSRHGGDTMA